MKKTSSENAFEYLFKKTREAILILDHSGKILTINSAAERLFQIKQEKIRGKSIRKIIPTPLLQQTMDRLKKKPDSQPISLTINQRTTSHGDETILQATVIPQPAQHKVTGYLVVTRDITKERKMEKTLQENQHLYRFVVENSPWAMYAVTADGTVTWLNSTFEKLSGWKRSEWLGKNFSSIIHPDDLPLAIKTLRETLRGKKVPPYQLRVRSKSGEYLNGEFKTGI